MFKPPDIWCIEKTYVEENDVNIGHFTLNNSHTFATLKKSLNSFTADMDDNYTMVNLANKYNGTDSITHNDNSFSANATNENHAYFVLEATSSMRDKHNKCSTSLDDLSPPRFSVLGFSSENNKVITIVADLKSIHLFHLFFFCLSVCHMLLK